MSTRYHSIHWNLQKKYYDATLAGALILGFGAFAGVSLATNPNLTIETLLMRGTAFLCLLLLQVILCIGPLARLSRWFLPLLYNRRHLGVCMFLLAVVHGTVALVQHHALGNRFPLVSVFTSYADEFSRALHQLPALAHVPFEPFGIGALVILFLMAATSHDFWLRLLGASFWKSMHLLVYVAYGLIILHVALGFLQAETSVVYTIIVFAGAALVFGLHLAAYLQGSADAGTRRRNLEDDGYVKACRVGDLEPGRGYPLRVGKRRIALFLHDNRVFALNGVCRHQGGPIAEGRVVDGCVTCPWHGWQYRPEDGCSPPPFEEHVSTYPVEIRDHVVYVKPERNPQGTVCEGAAMTLPPDSKDAGSFPPFYIGYLKALPEPYRPFLNAAATAVLVAAPLLTGILAYNQSAQPPGKFEFGQSTALSGVLYTTPVPSLYVTPEGTTDGYHVLLCSEGKFGVPDSWSTFDGTAVTLSGTLIYQDGTSMLEVATSAPPERFTGDATPPDRPETETLGNVELIGELVDTKCYLGVMRPASGKVHRACAIRCLSGGIPPGLLVHTGQESAVIMLASPTKEPLQYDVTWAGRNVLVHGDLERQNGFSLIRVETLTLYEDPSKASADSST